LYIVINSLLFIYQKNLKGPGGACVRRWGGEGTVPRHSGTMASPSLTQYYLDLWPFTSKSGHGLPVRELPSCQCSACYAVPFSI